MSEALSLRSWRMLDEEAVRRDDRDLARTLTDPSRLPVLEADDQDLLTRLRTLAGSTADRLR
jgi:hypothetical protein